MSKRIFVFEHDKALLDVVKFILVSTGYEVYGCSNPDCVITDVGHCKPDAILLDVVMVDIQGTELCRLLDESPVSKHIPIIAFSTNRQSHDLKKICADDVVDKPFDVNRLLESIADQLGKAAQS